MFIVRFVRKDGKPDEEYYPYASGSGSTQGAL